MHKRNNSHVGGDEKTKNLGNKKRRLGLDSTRHKTCHAMNDDTKIGTLQKNILADVVKLKKTKPYKKETWRQHYD